MFLIFVLLATISNSLVCNYDTINNTVTVGDSVVLCLHFPVGTEMKRIAYKITVDTYTALKSSGVYSVVKTDTAQTSAITLQFKNATYPSKYLAAADSLQYVANMFSYIIRTSNGVVEAIQQENSVFCSGCSGQCIDGENCFVKKADSDGDNDPKIFISWIGTDASGNYMLSQTKRLSRFTKYSVTDAYSQALKLFTS